MSSSNRNPWQTSTVLNQSLLDACADNLTTSLEMICEIDLGSKIIYASDRNKYVGDRFYEAICKFPTIERTLGEYLSTEVEFSTLTVSLSNVDGRFNDYLPGGSMFGGWIGKRITVKIGLRDVASTYQTLFTGKITDIGGVQRSTTEITLIARDDFDMMNVNFPTSFLSVTQYPSLSEDMEGTILPFILGNWAEDLANGLGIPTYITNGNAGIIEPTFNPIGLRWAVNPTSFVKLKVKRGDIVFDVPGGNISSINPTLSSLNVAQGFTAFDGSAYQYASGDTFFAWCQETTLGANQINLVKQALKILETFTPINPATQLDITKWDQVALDVTSIKSRVWVNEPQSVLSYIRSMFQQIRCDVGINKTQKITLVQNWFDKFTANPSHKIKNWDVAQGTFSVRVDEKNNVNRLQGAYDYQPSIGENAKKTGFFRNDASITQIGKTISKQIVFPNLYDGAQVEYQTKETLKMTSSILETITVNLTWRSLLKDLGEFVKVDVKIGAAQFAEIPCQVRSIGVDPDGVQIPVVLLSFQTIPFTGWVPPGSGIVGGVSATITNE
jgi:hypothetical protein